MPASLNEQIASERRRRDAALCRIELGVEATTQVVAQKVEAAKPTNIVKSAIVASPWASCFASLGAGALFSRLLTGGGSSHPSEPQRVIIEIQSPNGTVTPVAAAAAATPFNPLDMLMQAMTVYGAVRRSMNDLPPGFFAGSEPEQNEAAQTNAGENPI